MIGMVSSDSKCHDVPTRDAAEDAKFMLQRDGLEPAGIQERRGPCIIFEFVILDLKANIRWVIIGMTFVGHRHDAGVHIWTRRGDRLLEMSRECRDSASARQGITDKRETAEPGHNGTSAE